MITRELLRFSAIMLILGAGYALGINDFWVGLAFAALGGYVLDMSQKEV